MIRGVGIGIGERERGDSSCWVIRNARPGGDVWCCGGMIGDVEIGRRPKALG